MSNKKYTVSINVHPRYIKQACELFVVSTYPLRILKRRLDLLTNTERRKVNKLWKRAENLIEQIDMTIAQRAEIEKDPWK